MRVKPLPLVEQPWLNLVYIRNRNLKRKGRVGLATGESVTADLKLNAWAVRVFMAQSTLSLLPVVPVYKVTSWRCCACDTMHHLLFLSEYGGRVMISLIMWGHELTLWGPMSLLYATFFQFRLKTCFKIGTILCVRWEVELSWCTSVYM